jgi:hypothetical protein
LDFVECAHEIVDRIAEVRHIKPNRRSKENGVKDELEEAREQ